MKKVNVLGTEYTIKTASDDKEIEDAFGYCDYSSKEIVLAKDKVFESVNNAEWQKKKTLRHEIIHAFLNESGLIRNTYCVDGGWAANEEMVDWIAIQFPKMQKAFEEAGCL